MILKKIKEGKSFFLTKGEMKIVFERKIHYNRKSSDYALMSFCNILLQAVGILAKKSYDFVLF